MCTRSVSVGGIFVVFVGLKMVREGSWWQVRV